jgi:tRNA G18 (ribose-2'-O)-methylase SpoU
VAAVPRGGCAPAAVELGPRSALVLGGEGEGLPPELLARCDERVSVPLAAGVDSLNVAVAAAVLLYETVRRGNRND